MPNLLHCQLYPEVGGRLFELLQAGPVHGSTVRDLFIEHARGRFCVDDHAEKLLVELVNAGLVRATHKDPTVSQRAFIGLQYSNATYPRELMVPGTVEHNWFALTAEGRLAWPATPKPVKDCRTCIRAVEDCQDWYGSSLCRLCSSPHYYEWTSKDEVGE